MLLLFSFFAIISQFYAQEAFDILQHDVRIVIEEDGRFQIDETQQVFFKEQRRGIIRKIPFKYEVGGKPYTLTISDPQVQGHKSMITRQGGDLVLRIGDANKYVNGQQEYRFSYDVSGGIIAYDDHDEFYWNVVGFETDTETKKVHFSVALPDSWRDSIHQFRAFTGLKGSKNADLNLELTEGVITGATILPLRPKEGITLAISIPKGLVRHTSSQSISSDSDAASQVTTARPAWIRWLTAIPIAVAGFLLMLWNRIRQPHTPTDVPTQYYAPEGLSPAEVGTFYDYKVNRRDIISLLPYWGDLGYITMDSSDTSGEIYFSKKKDIDASRPGYEHTYFNALFDNRDGVYLSDLTHLLPTTMHRVSIQLKREVKDMQLYDAGSQWWHMGILIALGVISILSGIFLMIAFQAFVAGIGMILLGIGAIVFHFQSPKLSDKGQQYHDHLRGLYRWLKDPDSQEMSALLQKDPRYLQDIFPYVLAFGLDQSWQRRWDDYDIPAPHWYGTGGMFGMGPVRYGQFTKDFQPHKIEQVFYTPAPPAPSSSSGGGGFSGGGMAGGGFGGGGTSSW